MAKLKIVPLSSLHKVFPEGEPEKHTKTAFTTLKNEPLSVQFAYRLEENSAAHLSVNAVIETDLPVSLYSVGYVPVAHTAVDGLADSYPPGLFPDILIPKKVNPQIKKLDSFLQVNTELGEKTFLHAGKDCWKSIWLTFGESKNCPCGNHTVKVSFYSRDDMSLVGESSITVKVIDAKLPAQTLKYTNWLHCDCIADVYGVEVFSDEFFAVLEKFVRSAAQNGMNTLLTPCFTPPLDTARGEYRRVVQLVKITVRDGKYLFDFSLLKRFMDVARRCGIRYFEHSHLFSQWGAECAPQIVADVGGRQRRIFGWQTKASGKKYSDFLHAYIPALLDFLKSEKCDKKFLFHISDEPFAEHIVSFGKAKSVIGDMLDGYTVIDALSEYDIYKKGLVEIPVVSTNHVRDFKGKCKNYWCYYTGGEVREGQSNRFIACSSERNRMIGIQMYAARVKGILHWAFNFYYDVLSRGTFDPCKDPDGFAGRAAGTTYFVYPTPDRDVYQSIRQKVFYEGINDFRALSLLEKLKGRKYAEDLIEEFYGKVDFFTSAGSEEKLLSFREELNKRIEQSI
ncbi:MAG: DUF4091 domain-containing protein [Candidatus Neoclostridium sp.]